MEAAILSVSFFTVVLHKYFAALHHWVWDIYIFSWHEKLRVGQLEKSIFLCFQKINFWEVDFPVLLLNLRNTVLLFDSLIKIDENF